MFVARNQGRIVAASLERNQGCQEAIDSRDPELLTFLRSLMAEDTEGSNPLMEMMRESDLAIARVVEDLIDILIANGQIQITQFPEAAQKKLLSRRNLREQISNSLFSTEESDSFLP